MRLCDFRRDGRNGIAVDAGDGARGLFAGDPAFPGELVASIAAGADLAALGHRIVRHGAPIDLGAVTILPPVGRGSKMICVGLNYGDHIAEVGLKKPKDPEVFARFTSSLIGAGAPILRPPESSALDFEAELAVVIGRAGRRIPKDRALEHVAGYTVFNDATLRDVQFRTPQWTLGKNFDGTGALGPWLATPDSLPQGASGLRIQGRLNGEIVQDSNTGHLIFDVPTLIARLSVVMTLEPGDVIATGTPSGVGYGRTPRLYMKSGDVFEAEIEGIGVLVNPIRDEDCRS